MLVFRAIYVSIFIHLFLYLSILNSPTYWTPPIAKDLAEIEVIHRPFDENGKTIVRQTVAPEKMQIEDDADARFLSELRQRVLIETRANKSGLTQNANPNLPQLSKIDRIKKLQERSYDGYEPIELPKPNDVQLEGESTVGELLPNDVSVGSFTALNTDQFKYYSFYSRIEELVRFRWETQVRAVVDSYDPRVVMQNIGRKNWVTHVEFLIAPDGTLKVSRIMKESGVKGFDAAAVKAFKDARYFPNPPAELVESDGFVHLKYSFNVYFEPSAFATAN